MATQPTNLPVPSELPRDLKFNAGKIDEFVTSGNHVYVDRFGNKHRIIEGINYDANQAMLNYGYITKKSFEIGATLNTPNTVLQWESNGEFYRWDGDWTQPKVVPAGSTPDSTGGIGEGKWVGVGDASLRGDLNNPNGGTHITVGSKTIDELLSIRISDPRWNINSTNTPQVNAQNLNTLIDYAITSGRLNIIIDTNVTVDDITVPVRKKTEVFFYQDGGEINGLYRRASIPVGAPSNVRVQNGLAQESMSQFYNSSSPTVVIMGDSIATDGPNSLSPGDGMFSIISKAIANSSKDRTINFINRAIGGQTWLTANSKPTGFPAWYTDTSKDWLEYVKSDSPDLLILAFGMNDANGFNAGALHAVVNKIKAWEKVPSLLFVTNPVPAISTTWSGGQGFYATIFQEGRDWAAGYARSYAGFYGYSILDINRQFCLIRDGRDYVGVPLERAGVYNQSYIHSTSLIARDLSLSGEVANWANDKVLLVKVGHGGLDVVYIANINGNFKVTAFCDGQHDAPYIDVQTTVPVTVGQTLDVSVQDNTLTLFSGITKVISFSLIRTGGETPVIAEWQDSPGSGPFASVTVNVGNWLQCQYTARDSDIWGHDDGTADTKYPEGGNGINHYSSKGLELIVKPVVEAFDFRRKIVTSTEAINTMNTDVTALTVVQAVRVGNQVSLTGRVSCAQPATYKLFDLPPEFRPNSQKIVSTSANGITTWGECIIDIHEDGSVNLAFGDATTFVLLDGITFEV
ncbi:SGNH/GDSL hydrolase family protein [Escherichia coli]|uniref:tail fiber/spike domain-containing protein n=1 Tax=Escherichia coli TaxID=562 RepID=UPI00042A8D72|nr:SGNH/GDSL hydrolase family protein [Escherichia coli]